MQISVSGKQIKVGSALSKHVEERLTHGISKYFDKAIKADVVFSKEAHLACADILVNEGTGTGVVIKGNGKSEDIYTAFEEATEKIEKQLRRYKNRIKDHNKEKVSQTLDMTKYVIGRDESNEEELGDNPLIIAEKQSKLDRLSVSDAVMHMDLADLPALLFVSEKTDTISLVYHRKDGNLSWIDTGITQKN